MADQDNQDRDDQNREDLERQEAELDAQNKEAQAREQEDKSKGSQEEDDKSNDGKDAAEIKAELERVRKALAKANKEAEKYRHEAKPWRDLNVDPEEVSQWAKDREEAEIRKAEERGAWEELREKMKEQHTRELEKREEDLNRMRSTMESYLVDAQATDAISKLKGEPELLLPHIKSKVKPIQEGDRYEVRVLDEKGEPRVKDGGDYFTVTDLVAEMQQSSVYGRAFAAPDKSGSGTRQSSQQEPAKRVPNKKRAEMSPREKSAFIGEHGIDAYNALPLR